MVHFAIFAVTLLVCGLSLRALYKKRMKQETETGMDVAIFAGIIIVFGFVVLVLWADTDLIPSLLAVGLVTVGLVWWWMTLSPKGKTTHSDLIYQFDDTAFRSIARSFHPELLPQLLIDYRAYKKPELTNFLDQLDTSSIDRLVEKYGDEFERLKADLPKPIAIPEATRFEHTWILGVTGAGKTQLMQYLLSKDFETNSSIMVIDSQGDLIKTIGQVASIQDRVILVEPGEIALNPFDLKGDQAIDLLTFVFSAMGGELTARQSTLYRYCIRLLQEIPEANLSTFMRLLRPESIPYQKYLAKLSEPARLFFEDEFTSKEFREVKEQVGWRLKLLLENETFERMFNAPRTRLNLSQALNEGKIVLVDTNKDKLGSERSALFGRFFVALLLLASQSRRDTARHPTFVYIDEAWELLNDNKVAEILDQARKTKIGLVLANQRTSQITNPNMLQALTTCAIKFVSTDDDKDTHMLARPMGTKPEFIAQQAKKGLSFALSIRKLTETAVSVSVPVGVLEKLPKAPLTALRARMRSLYGIEAKKKPKPPEADDGEIKPSSKL